MIIEQVLIESFNRLKKRFCFELPNNHWVIVDFFTDMDNGFLYFKEQVENDKELVWLKNNALSEESIDRVYDHVVERLNHAIVFSMFQQSMRQ